MPETEKMLRIPTRVQGGGGSGIAITAKMTRMEHMDMSERWSEIKGGDGEIKGGSLKSKGGSLKSKGGSLK